MNGLPLALALAGSLLTAQQQDGCRPSDQQATKAKPVTIAEVLDNPAKLVDVPIRVRGRLVNAGGNYYSRNRRIVLTDADGRELPVEPWLPLNAPPVQTEGQARPTLAEYLDKTVELAGTLQKKSAAAPQVQYVLHVAEATILPDSR